MYFSVLRPFMPSSFGAKKRPCIFILALVLFNTHTLKHIHVYLHTYRQTHKTYMNHMQQILQNWDHVSVREQTTCACMHR